MKRAASLFLVATAALAAFAAAHANGATQDAASEGLLSAGADAAQPAAEPGAESAAEPGARATPVGIFNHRDRNKAKDCKIPFEDEIYSCRDEQTKKPFELLYRERDKEAKKLERELRRIRNELAVLNESLASSTLVRIDHVKQALFDLGHYDANKDHIRGFHGEHGFDTIIRSQRYNEFTIEAVEDFQCKFYPSPLQDCEPSRKTGWLTFFQARYALCVAGANAQGPAARVVADWFARGKVYPLRPQRRNAYAYAILRKYLGWVEGEQEKAFKAYEANKTVENKRLLDYYNDEFAFARAYQEEVVKPNLRPKVTNKVSAAEADERQSELIARIQSMMGAGELTPDVMCPVPPGMRGPTLETADDPLVDLDEQDIAAEEAAEAAGEEEETLWAGRAR